MDAFKLTPAGLVPLIAKVGAGNPDAVKVKVNPEKTVDLADAALVICGGESPGCTGVTNAADEGMPVPTSLVAATVQLYCVLLASPRTIIGDILSPPVRFPGMHVTR